MANNIDWKKYLIVFLITACLFLSSSYLSNYFSSQKIDQIKSIQDNIAINILSSETQFSLLQESSCKNAADSVLSGELDELGRKLEFEEENLGMTEEVSYLKKYYSLLQIKDYILMKKISASCKVKSAFILYFYTTKDICSECEKQSLVLTSLRATYPELRVYSFDYSVDVSAVKALLQIYKIKDTMLPAHVIDDEALTGFHDASELDSLINKSFKFQEAKPSGSTKTSS